MSSNHLKLNTGKMQFSVLGTQQQLVKMTLDSVSLKMDQIAISRNITCLGVVIDRELTFATHVLRLSSHFFYQLRQLCTIHHSLNEETAKSLIHVFVIMLVFSGITKIC